MSCVCSNIAADVLCKGTWDREVCFSVISLHRFRIAHNTIKFFSHFDSSGEITRPWTGKNADFPRELGEGWNWQGLTFSTYQPLSL